MVEQGELPTAALPVATYMIKQAKQRKAPEEMKETKRAASKTESSCASAGCGEDGFANCKKGTLKPALKSHPLY